MVEHAFNPCTQKQRQMDVWEFEACLIYSSRTARAMQRNAALQIKQETVSMLLEESQSLRSHTEINTKEPQVRYEKGLFFWDSVFGCMCAHAYGSYRAPWVLLLRWHPPYY